MLSSVVELGIRTPDPLHAKQVLSHLSYSPKVVWGIDYMHGAGGWIGGEGGDGWKTMSQWGRQCVEWGAIIPSTTSLFCQRGIHYD